MARYNRLEDRDRVVSFHTKTKNFVALTHHSLYLHHGSEIPAYLQDDQSFDRDGMLQQGTHRDKGMQSTDVQGRLGEAVVCGKDRSCRIDASRCRHALRIVEIEVRIMEGDRRPKDQQISGRVLP